MRIGTWNVRILKEVGKLEQVKREMKRYGLNILGVSEVTWIGQGEKESDGIKIIYSCEETCERGVEIMFDEEAARRITEVQQCSDRPIMVRVSAEPVDIVLI
jgi:hypothetical protein